MAEYAKGYADQTAWMHESGLSEIKAAVIRQAVLDYVTNCKTVIALSGEVTGKNIEKLRAQKINHMLREKHRQKQQQSDEEFLLVNVFNEAEKAQIAVEDVERFFLSQNFLLVAENVTGKVILDAAKEFVRRWAEDEFNGRMDLPFRAVDDPKQVADIKSGTYGKRGQRREGEPPRKRGRPRKTPK